MTLVISIFVDVIFSNITITVVFIRDTFLNKINYWAACAAQS